MLRLEGALDPILGLTAGAVCGPAGFPRALRSTSAHLFPCSWPCPLLGVLRTPGSGRGPKVLRPPSPQEADDVRDALAPSLACAAAHAGDLEALQALAELVRPLPALGDQLQLHQAQGAGALPRCGQDCLSRGLLSSLQLRGTRGCVRPPLGAPRPCPFPVAYLALPGLPSVGDDPMLRPRAVT